jgi:hippurate hydrolase
MNSVKKYSIKFDYDKYIKLRREFHKIPEIGLKEYKTKKLIYDNLNSFPNFQKFSKLTEVGETGFYIDIYGNGENHKSYSSNLISIRADIDALPILEETGVDYSSQHPGMMHACGHDSHMTILIATIEYYLNNIDKVPKNFGVRFLFQPAEEGLGGAALMIEGGCLNNVSEIYGLHNSTTFKVGEIGVISGTIMARIDVIDINIKGRGGHSSVPHICHSPIDTGVQIITALHHIGSQEVDSINRHVIGIGCFKAGEAPNVIPETGVIKGTIRSLDDEVGDKILKRVMDVSESIGKINYSEVKVSSVNAGLCTWNHKEPTNLVDKIASKYFKSESYGLPYMASEDFSYYQKKIPGCFFMLGTGDETHVDFPHTPRYNYNDDSTPYGLEMFIRIIEEKAQVSLI